MDDVSMDTLTGLELQTQQTVILFVFSYLSIRTSMNFFSSLSYSISSVGLDHMSLSESWRPMTPYTIVHSLDHFWWILTPAGQEHPRRAANLEMLWPNRCHSLALCQTRSNSYTFPFFLLLTSTLRRKCSPTNVHGATIKTLPVFSGQNFMSDLCLSGVYFVKFCL